MTRHRTAERHDEEPWTVFCIHQAPDGLMETSVRVAEHNGRVCLITNEMGPIWFQRGDQDLLAHFLLIAGNKAAGHVPAVLSDG